MRINENGEWTELGELVIGDRPPQKMMDLKRSAQFRPKIARDLSACIYQSPSLWIRFLDDAPRSPIGGISATCLVTCITFCGGRADRRERRLWPARPGCWCEGLL
jgi:hypothetical protein